VSKIGGLAGKRVIVAIFLLAWVLASVFYGGIWLALFIGSFTFIGSGELVNMAKARNMNPPFRFIIFINLLLITLASFKLYNLILGTFAVSAMIAFILILFRGKDASVNDVSMTILAIIYGGLFPMHAVLIRNMDSTSFSILGKDFPIGVGFVVLTFLAVSFCDIFAFYAGTRLGKHPLWKAISPKKTIEGAIGGTTAAILISIFVGIFIGLSIVQSIIIGFILAVFAQIGDLAESMLKREVGIKDSGNIFPGHGGVLDRADSYIFTVVAGYYLFKFFIM